MAGRRTNLALLGLLPLAGLTGAWTFLLGSGPVAVVVIAHGVIGLCLLILLPWKSAIARRGLRRRRPGRPTSLVLAVAVVVALITGLAHSTGLAPDGLVVAGYRLTALQMHVGAAVIAFVPAIVHVRMRRIRPRPTDASRRGVLRAAAVLTAGGGLYALLEGGSRRLGWPGARRRSTGSYEVASGDPAGLPVTSWLFDSVPDIDASTWRLTVVSGGTARRWSVGDLRRAGHQSSAVLDCTGGWWSRQVWSGTRVADLLPAGSAGSVEVVSATGYRRRLPLTDDLLLAVDVAGAPLAPGHGAPARLVVPGRREYHWVKWVDRIEHDHRPWWWQPPLPLP